MRSGFGLQPFKKALNLICDLTCARLAKLPIEPLKRVPIDLAVIAGSTSRDNIVGDCARIIYSGVCQGYPMVHADFCPSKQSLLVSAIRAALPKIVQALRPFLYSKRGGQTEFSGSIELHPYQVTGGLLFVLHTFLLAPSRGNDLLSSQRAAATIYSISFGISKSSSTSLSVVVRIGFTCVCGTFFITGFTPRRQAISTVGLFVKILSRRRIFLPTFNATLHPYAWRRDLRRSVVYTRFTAGRESVWSVFVMPELVKWKPLLAVGTAFCWGVHSASLSLGPIWSATRAVGLTAVSVISLGRTLILPQSATNSEARRLLIS
jgi:hypothetical protein